MTTTSTNLFKVSNFIIQFKNVKQIELMTTTANIPGLTLGTIDIARSVVNDARPGDSLTYNDLDISVLCDEDLIAFKEVYNYIMSGAEPVFGNLDVVEPVFDATLFLTTNKNNIQHKLTFYNCFFKSISDIQLTSSSSDEENFTFDIGIGFSYYLFD
jgi:hypothetical protein